MAVKYESRFPGSAALSGGTYHCAQRLQLPRSGWERGMRRHELTAYPADTEVKGGKWRERNPPSLRTSLAQTATIWESCSWIQVWSAGDVEAKEVRKAISVFDSVLNVICNVEEGHQPLYIDFSTVKWVKTHYFPSLCVFIRLIFIKPFGSPCMEQLSPSNKKYYIHFPKQTFMK